MVVDVVCVVVGVGDGWCVVGVYFLCGVVSIVGGCG